MRLASVNCPMVGLLVGCNETHLQGRPQNYVGSRQFLGSYAVDRGLTTCLLVQ